MTKTKEREGCCSGCRCRAKGCTCGATCACNPCQCGEHCCAGAKA